MQNTISKNVGSSRTLASVPNFLTLYPTYEAFAQALINRELPIDLGPLNPAGCEVIGDALDKDTLLKDSTAALYGKDSTATPDEILVQARALITDAKAVTGYYAGNNAETRDIITGFAPSAVIVLDKAGLPNEYKYSGGYSTSHTYIYRSAWSNKNSPMVSHKHKHSIAECLQNGFRVYNKQIKTVDPGDPYTYTYIDNIWLNQSGDTYFFVAFG